jgi:hypothetical protein
MTTKPVTLTTAMTMTHDNGDDTIACVQTTTLTMFWEQDVVCWRRRTGALSDYCSTRSTCSVFWRLLSRSIPAHAVCPASMFVPSPRLLSAFSAKTRPCFFTLDQEELHPLDLRKSDSLVSLPASCQVASDEMSEQLLIDAFLEVSQVHFSSPSVSLGSLPTSPLILAVSQLRRLRLCRPSYSNSRCLHQLPAIAHGHPPAAATRLPKLTFGSNCHRQRRN